MRKGGYRSSRLLYPMVLNPIMNKNVMYFKVVKGKYVEVQEGEEYTFSIVANASSYDGEDWQPYKAFRHDMDSYCWRSAEGRIAGEWIEINLPYWYRKPQNPDPTRSGSEPPAVTALEVWTASVLDDVATKFKILGSYDGASWTEIRECEVKKPRASKMYCFALTYGDEENPLTIDQYPRYRYFRLEVIEGYGERFVGFGRIDVRAHVDHNEPVFTPSTNKWDGIAEKLFMQNDDCDGIIWEKVHKKQDIIFSNCSWYPGFYSSTSFHTTMFRPKDPIRPCISRTHSKFSMEGIQRTKDFLIAYNGTYYYQDTATLNVSNDGIHWLKNAQSGPGTWQGSGYGWSTKRNVGIMNGYRLEIADSGKIKWVKIPNASGSTCGDIMTNGSTGTEYQPPVQYIRVVNADGDSYISALQANYSYTDLSRREGEQTVWAACNWALIYLNGKYYAYGKFTDTRYWNSVVSEWQTISHVTIVESDDGFKHIRSYRIQDPVVGESFSEWCPYYFNDSYYIYEKGRIKTAGQWVSHAKVWKFGSSFGNTPVVKKIPDYVTVPLIGYNADGAYDTVSLVFNGSGPSLNRNLNIAGYFSNPFGDSNYGRTYRSTVYVKDGKPAEPFSHLVWRAAYKVNWWGSGATDEGGYVFIEGDLTSKAGQNSVAYGTSNIVINRDDDTWGPRGR